VHCVAWRPQLCRRVTCCCASLAIMACCLLCQCLTDQKSHTSRITAANRRAARQLQTWHCNAGRVEPNLAGCADGKQKAAVGDLRTHQTDTAVHSCYTLYSWLQCTQQGPDRVNVSGATRWPVAAAAAAAAGSPVQHDGAGGRCCCCWRPHSFILIPSATLLLRCCWLLLLRLCCVIFGCCYRCHACQPEPAGTHTHTLLCYPDRPVPNPVCCVYVWSWLCLLSTLCSNTHVHPTDRHVSQLVE
jgi:hypothetical protein